MNSKIYTNIKFFFCNKVCIDIVNIMYTHKHSDKQITALISIKTK